MATQPKLNLGYLVPEFPSQTHAFFWREVQALRSLGVKVHMLSTRRAAAGTCRHAFAAAAIAETHFLFPPQWLMALGQLVQHPVLTLRAARYVLGLHETPLRKRLPMLALLLPAAQLCAYSRRRGITHVHVHSCANAAHVAALSLVLGGCRYSLTLHGDLAVYGTGHRQKSVRAVFVACVTRPLQVQVCEVTGLPPARVPLLWMGVDTARFLDAGLRRSIAGELKVLTVARLNRAKGHRCALRALRIALDQGLRASYVIAGEGPERKSIELELETLGLQPYVQLVGEQSEDQVLHLLQHADALVLPSIGAGEAAPVAVMEAMSCGLPVVCSIIGGTADMITDGVDGFLVKQGDIDAIAERLITLGKDLPLRKKLGRAARERAELNFDCRPLAKKLLELICAPNDIRS